MKDMFLKEGLLIYPLLVSAIIHAGVFLPGVLHSNAEIVTKKETPYLTLNIVSSTTGKTLGNRQYPQTIGNRSMIMPEEKSEFKNKEKIEKKIYKKTDKSIAPAKPVTQKKTPAQSYLISDTTKEKQTTVQTESINLDPLEKPATELHLKKPETGRTSKRVTVAAKSEDISQGAGVSSSKGNASKNNGHHSKNARFIPAIVRGLSKPEYPRYSRINGEEGTVVLAVEILSGGKPGEIKIVSSSGYRRLDRASVKALEKATFIPGKVDGKEITSKKRIAFRFDLRD